MAVVLYTGASTSLLDTIRTEQKDDESIKLHSSSTGTSYVGLSNQGATCYLNSLLQTLFMTPEFRHAIFSWRYDQSKDTDQDHCIPLQLQKLFGYLAFGKNKSVDTVALTKSFGWEGSEVFQQQDVQELTRVLFDALEVSFKGTPLETIIDDIYAGELIDYIRCIDVDSQRERMDKFLDLSFAIVPFGQTKAMHSLSECIEMFLRPEMLDGDNQYYAEQFQKKVDAIKGLKFGKLPQIMSCNLKRFVYDFSGSYVSQKKINDVVKFPFILDMNRYVCKRKAGKHRNEVTRQHEHKPPQSSSTHDDEQCESVADLADEYEPNEEFERFLLQRMTELRTGAQADKDMTQVDDDEGKTNGTRTPPTVASDSVYHTPVRSGKVIIENNKTSEVVEPAASSSSSSAIPKVPDFSTMPDLVDEVGGLCPEQRQEQLETRMLSPNWSPDEIQALIRERGEWVYELFAVLIHAGAISGGHYYAYIKNLDDHEWYNFNDSTVTHISAEQVAEAWGGETTYTTSSYNSTYYYPTYPSPTTTTTMSTANAYMLMYRKVQVNPHHSHDSQTNEQDAGDDTDMMRNTKQQSVVSTSFPSTDSVPEYILEDVRQAEIRQEEKLREQEELRNKLELKVWWKGAERVVTTSREQLYKDFLLHLWSFLELHKEPEFDLTDSVAVADSTTNSSETSSASDEMVSQWPPINRMRLRLYSYYKTGADTFDYEEFANSSLEKMNIGAYRPLLLETRRVTEQFELYYLNGFNLEVDEFDRDTGKYNPVKKFRFPLGTTCTEFYERLSQSFGYPLGSFRVFKCSKNAYCDAKVHFIPQTSSQRISEDLLMSEYIKIGLERFDPAVESIDDTESSPAAIAYLDERNQISLRYNVYPSRDEIQLVQADFRWTVANLRARIAELCNLPVDETRLIRNSSAGAELKDDSVRLVDTNIYDKMTIYVQSGKALPEGYYNLCFSLFKPTEYKAGVQFLPANLNNYATVEDGMKDSSSIGDNMELASGVTAQSSSSKPAQPSCLWYSRRDSDYMDADSTIGRGTKRSSGTADHGVKRYVPADGSDVVFERPNGAWEASFETELDSIPSDQSVDITIPERAPTPLDTCMSTIAPSSSAASLPIIDEDEEMRVLYAKDGGTDEVAVEMSVFDRVVDVDPWDVIDAMGQEQRPCTPEIEDAPNQLSPNKSSSRACRVHSDTELAAQFDSLKTDLNTVVEAEVNANDFAERKVCLVIVIKSYIYYHYYSLFKAFIIYHLLLVMFIYYLFPSL